MVWKLKKKIFHCKYNIKIFFPKNIKYLQYNTTFGLHYTKKSEGQRIKNRVFFGMTRFRIYFSAKKEEQTGGEQSLKNGQCSSSLHFFAVRVTSKCRLQGMWKWNGVVFCILGIFPVCFHFLAGSWKRDRSVVGGVALSRVCVVL